MPIDSTAQLLFTIGANADDATENIARFRNLISKDLGEMGEEFDDWSKEVFGNLSTVNGALIAGGAALAAVAVGVGAFVTEAMGEYRQYADSVDHAMKVTGLGAEDLSVLHLAAAETFVSFDSLTNGIVRFESSVDKAANGGNKELIESFRRLGVSQADLTAGEQNLMPLLGKVMDGFHGLASGTDRAALAKDLFSRSGPELLSFLTRGSEGLNDFREKAESLGLTLSPKLIDDMRALKAAEEQLKAQHEALDVVIGKSLTPLKTFWETLKGAVAQTLRNGQALAMPGFFIPAVVDNYHKLTAEIQRAVDATKMLGDSKPAPPPPQQTLTEFTRLSELLTEIRDKSELIASEDNPAVRETQELYKFTDAAAKAQQELRKLMAEGKISAADARRELQAFATIPNQISELWAAWLAQQRKKELDETQKANDEYLDAEVSLRNRLKLLQQSGFEAQRTQLALENHETIQSLSEKKQYTEETMALVEQIYQVGLAKINAAERAQDEKDDDALRQKAAKEQAEFEQHFARLQEQMARVAAERTTGRQKIEQDERRELQQYSQAEEAKVIATATSEAQMISIMLAYEAIRRQISEKYKTELQTLINSQGWQGVFGSKFAEGLKGNEALLREWQSSTNQSLMLVKVSIEDLKDTAKQMFGDLAQGMGGAIAQALVFSQSFDDAMRQAAASTLESIAAQCLTQAIYSTAWGFFDLATGDYPGAEAAFEAAGLFALAGGGAAAVGRAIAPSSASAGSTAAGGVSGADAAGSAAGPAGGAGTATPGTTVIVTVNGHVIGPSGISELTDMINQQVYGNNLQLYASANKQGNPL